MKVEIELRGSHARMMEFEAKLPRPVSCRLKRTSLALLVQAANSDAAHIVRWADACGLRSFSIHDVEESK